MSTTNKWLLFTPSNTNMTGDMLQNVTLNLTNVNRLAKAISTPNAEQIFFGDYTNWLSSLVFFPINLTNYKKSPKVLQLNGLDVNIGSSTSMQYVYVCDYKEQYKSGFTLGEYFVKPKFNDFRDYEPYTSFRIYLPYYGYVELPCNEIMNKWLQFRLSIDPFTGQAVYYICATKQSVPWNKDNPYRVSDTDAISPYAIYDVDSKIIGVYNFQLGAVIPISSTGSIDVARNLTMGAIRLGAALASSGISEAIGAYQTVSTVTDKTVRKTFNKKNPQGKTDWTRERERHTVSDSSQHQKAVRINECFSTAAQALASLALSPTSDKPNNLLVNNIGCESIKIIRKTARFVDTGTGYAKLYGYPVGAVYKLSDLSGYTVISSCHLDGSGFTGTLEEKLMIEEALGEGIILPENNITYNVTTNITNGFASPATTTIAKNGFTTVYIIPDANFGYPDSVSVTGASYTYEKTEGAVYLSNPTGSVTITAECVLPSGRRLVTANITNGTYTGASAIDNNIDYLEEKIIADLGYNPPTSVEVTGCEATWDSETETLIMRNFTGNVTITATCEKDDTTLLAGTYVFNGAPDFTSQPFTQSIDFKSYFTKYNKIGLADNVMTYYSGTTSTYDVYKNGAWVNDNAKTVILETAQGVTTAFYTWFLANTTKQ